MKTIFRDREQGAVAPLVAILMVVFILCIAVVVDLGHQHNVKVQLQRAVDAAALAGAQQLDSSTGQDSNATAVARAAANINRIDNKTGWLDDPNVLIDFVIELGNWDKESLGAEPSSRFTSVGGDTANAIRVTAKVKVEYFFFIFSTITSGTVSADAIAVNIFEEQTLPIALVSCVPTGGEDISIKSPGLSVCDITTYRFHSDTEDTAAWTSLTFSPASLQKIMEFLDEDGLQTFNEVVYGTGSAPAHRGLENHTVATATRITTTSYPVVPGVPADPEYSDIARGCIVNDGLSIGCGLGDDFVITGSNDPADPLDYDPLPRWDFFDEFERLLYQNDNLKDKTQAELQALYDETIAIPPFGADDHRFTKFIKLQGGTYKPDFNEVLRYAGYPPVWVNNGTVLPALRAFLDDLTDEDKFRAIFSTDNFPFTFENRGVSGGHGYSLKLTLPVIFAGTCDDWKAISSGPAKTDNTLFYIGTADFLLTRGWATSDCYDHGDTNAITITNPAPSADGCPPPTTPAVDYDYYDPELSNDNPDRFLCAGGKTPNAALEGALRPPSREGDETKAGILKVYLVE